MDFSAGQTVITKVKREKAGPSPRGPGPLQDTDVVARTPGSGSAAGSPMVKSELKEEPCIKIENPGSNAPQQNGQLSDTGWLIV